MEPQSVYDFTIKDSKGNDVDLSLYRGKVLLIVNVASKCGLTNNNYTELNELYQKYKEHGFEILAFPCNQFGGQEPGTNDEIVDFVCTRFKSEFPIFDKVEVNGENTAPLYKFLKKAKYGIIGDNIQWNFAKFLVDKNGQAVDRYYPTTSPLNIEQREGLAKEMDSQSEKDPQSVFEFTVKDAKGNDVDLSIYMGKVLLIVNVASKCGMTNSNYVELNQLYEKYKEQGLEILAFPCNQFGEEEPGSNDQILDFVCTRFKSEFPIFDKIEVNGKNAAPLYKFLKKGKWGILGDDIQWNFAKFLVDKNGQAVDRYYPTTSPLTIERDIKRLLGVL
ncbi:hypothetical protein M9H77_32688 [Catharanthus roseus]|uniref:Uncharacterized protein n=1 Tax=Catharanthus roseus TaxID=4058 RepID=A0ACC0A7I9_CATRO|nr:hypothetical protein M9H77_32688 [Catharanthus roseus]